MKTSKLNEQRRREALRRAIWHQWLATRPATVRQIAERYPPGTRFNVHGQLMHVVSYDESGGLNVTPIDPTEDYAAAVAQRQPVCKCCLRKLDALRIPSGAGNRRRAATEGYENETLPLSAARK